jgi:hypothetical protein
MAESSKCITIRARTKCDSDVEHCARTQTCHCSMQARSTQHDLSRCVLQSHDISFVHVIQQRALRNIQFHVKSIQNTENRYANPILH